MEIAEGLRMIVERRGEVFALALEHLKISSLALSIALAVGIPLGILISRYRRAAAPIIGLANVVQAVPSLALLGFLIPLLGIGERPSVAMIAIYSLLPIVKNTFSGMVNVDDFLVEVGRGMGMTEGQITLRVRLPLAVPFIMAGVRIGAVTAVGFTTVAALAGAGGLGQLIYRGLFMVNVPMILAGAIPTMALVLAVDYSMALLERMLAPRGLRQ